VSEPGRVGPDAQRRGLPRDEYNQQLMPVDPQEFLETIAPLLGWYYLALGGLNLGACWSSRRAGKPWPRPVAWLAFALLFTLLASLAFAGLPLELPDRFKTAVDAVLGPVMLTAGSFCTLAVFYLGRRWFVIPAVGWALLNASLLFLGASLADPHFAATVLKPDNVPILAMVYLLGFFTWLGAAQAVENDRRLQAGQPPTEEKLSATTLVWPDLVYIELICTLILSAVLIVWSMALRAPLEQPANPAVTPNPSKAPWYFVGLQEMLVFFDPSIAGVLLPGLIILGLMAIPYLDRNPKGSGYYTIAQRRFGYVVFQLGFLQLWILLILIGTFFRGPNWSFFGLYEPRDPQKLAAMGNVKLSEAFWAVWLGRAVPQPANGGLARLRAVLWREIPGLLLVGAYFVAVPILLGRTVLRSLRRQMGRARYWIMVLLLLMMIALPLKMVLRWTCNLSYVVSMPEYFFSF